MRVVSTVCQDSKTPVKRLATYPYETKVVRKNYIRMKHAYAEKSEILVNSSVRHRIAICITTLHDQLKWRL